MSVSYRLFLAAVLATLTCGIVVKSSTTPVNAQALIPHTVKLNFGNLEEQALSLAKDAAQLAQFEQYDMALARARLAVQLAPKSYQAQAILGTLYLRKEEYPKAIASLSTAANLKKDNSAILFSLGSAYVRNGDYQLAIQKIKQGLALTPKEPSALFDLGNAYFLTKRYEDAVAEYNNVIKIEPKFWAATNNIGLVEYERGNPDLAAKKWQEAIVQAELTEDKAAEAKLALAVATYTKGDRAQGIKLGESALKIDPRYGKLSFLKENLWGDKLLADTKVILEVPMLKELVDKSVTPVKPPKR